MSLGSNQHLDCVAGSFTTLVPFSNASKVRDVVMSITWTHSWTSWKFWAFMGQLHQKFADAFIGLFGPCFHSTHAIGVLQDHPELDHVRPTNGLQLGSNHSWGKKRRESQGRRLCTRCIHGRTHKAKSLQLHFPWAKKLTNSTDGHAYYTATTLATVWCACRNQTWLLQPICMAMTLFSTGSLKTISYDLQAAMHFIWRDRCRGWNCCGPQLQSHLRDPMCVKCFGFALWRCSLGRKNVFFGYGYWFFWTWIPSNPLKEITSHPRLQHSRHHTVRWSLL